MANIGSCKIGFNPSPSLGTGNKSLNGFEVKIKKTIKPKIIICWKITVKSLSLIDLFNDEEKYKKFVKVSINNHNNKLPSWLPHKPLIL